MNVRTAAPTEVLTRRIVVPAVLVVGCLALSLVALGSGSLQLSIPEVVDGLLGRGQDFAGTVVREWRAPRVVAGLAFGAALGIAGAVFQSVTRNPLGSPDVIGLSTGAYTGALVSITVVGTGYLSTTAGALLGGIATAVVVYLLSWRGGLQMFRLVVVGVAVTALLSGVNSWLLLRAQLEVAMSASLWGAGSLSLADWSDVWPALLTLGLCLPVVVALSGALRQLELGDDAARAHGVPVEPVRLVLLLAGVVLTSLVTAVAGPIAFVALASPQIAHRLCRSAGLPLTASALTGAFVLLAADYVGQHLLPSEVPVGLITVVIGGGYLMMLLIHEARRRVT